MEDSYKEQAFEMVKSIVKPIVGEVECDFLKEGDQWRLNIQTKNYGKLIGNHGEVLSGLQHLIRVIVHKKFPQDRTHFLVDVNERRRKREEFIQNKVPDYGKEEVLGLGKTVIMSNLSSYERKIIHKMLDEIKGLETTSVGERYNRKLLIRPTSDAGSQGMEDSIVVDIEKEVKLND